MPNEVMQTYMISFLLKKTFTMAINAAKFAYVMLNSYILKWIYMFSLYIHDILQKVITTEIVQV